MSQVAGGFMKNLPFLFYLQGSMVFLKRKSNFISIMMIGVRGKSVIYTGMCTSPTWF
jgi:hypothetical protein